MGRVSRRTFLKQSGVAATGLPFLPLAGCITGRGAGRSSRPNVVLIITDDQGFGDVGCNGNDLIRTPNLDRLGKEGVRFTHFHASPVCSPTRSSLMTGRYNYRTGIVDTFQGRSMMYPDEVTLAEMLSGHGYCTGIFGKWHLGDNYPLRAMDQGFQESLVHKGGGICQPSEPRNNSYFDPILKKNGQDVRAKGYCTDVFTDAAIKFIKLNASRPFFLYFAPNAPHEPLEIGETYWKPYSDQGLNEKTARVYGMITNLDENVGRLLATLCQLSIDQNTLVIFLTDNGPSFGGVERYNAGMRGQKGTVYEGGIRVPCFVRWPGVFPSGTFVDRVAAHIDLLPTILNVCHVSPPAKVRLDGRSLLPLIIGEGADWPDRMLFFQWHRGDEPQPFKNCAVLTQRYKLVNGNELYDLGMDPREKNDIAGENPERVQRLRVGYEAWFDQVGRPRGYAPPRIVLGTPHETPAVLTRQDWRGAESWHDGQLGYWEVRVARSGRYQFTAEFPESDAPTEAQFALNGVALRQPLDQGRGNCAFPVARVPSGDGRLETSIGLNGKPAGPRWVSVERLPN